jgi:hypothetical protein
VIPEHSAATKGAEKLLRYYFPGVIPVAVEGAGDCGKAKPVALRLKSQPASRP